MKSARWVRLDALLEAAWELPEGERRRLLRESCDDTELRQEAEWMLAADREAQAHFRSLAELAGLAATDAPAPDLAGRRIGSYRLRELLGRGGMGVVYAAERADGVFEREVAIKLLPMGLIRPEAHRRFLAERQILAGLEHPVIARLLDGGFAADGTPYFVMERVDGERIDRWCDARRLNVRQRLRLLVTLCQAVEFAHRRLIVHRDLKPGNVLVTAEGEVKLLDFGVAKLLAEGGPELTATWGAAPATLAWAAPEQLEGGQVTTATDTYALGALAYLLLVGVPPFESEGLTPAEIVRRRQQPPKHPLRRFAALGEAERASIAAARSTTPQALGRALAGDLDAILTTALTPEPERRYASAAELAGDLRRHLDGRPVGVRPPSVGYRLSRFVGRHRLGAAAAGAIALLAIGLVAVSLISAARSRAQAEQIRGQASRIVAERDRAEEVTAFLVDLFEVSDPDRAQGREITARELLARGGARIRGELADQPATRAAMLLALGRVHRRLGEPEPAAEYLEAALAFYRQTPESEEAIETLHELAQVRHSQERWDEAEPLARQALERAQFHYGPRDPRVAAVLVTLGRIATGGVKYEAAERWLRRALAIESLHLGEDHSTVAGTRIDLGIALHYRGRIEEAVRLFERAAATFRRRPGEINRSYGEALYFLANIALARREHAVAEGYVREGLAVMERLYGSDHHATAAMLATAAELEQHRGHSLEAVRHARRLLDIQADLSSPLRVHRLTAKRILAENLLKMHRYVEAESMARQAAELAETIERSSDQAESMRLLGNALRKQERYAEARAAYREVLEDLAPRLPAGRPHPVVGSTEHELGVLARRQGAWREAAERQRRAIELVEPLMRTEGGSLARFLAIARLELARALAALDRHPEAQELLAQALPVLDSAYGEEDERIHEAMALAEQVALVSAVNP